MDLKLFNEYLNTAQQQLENAPLENRGQAILDFSQDEKLTKYLKALYGFKCQICSFTFEQSSGGFYAETFYFGALSDDGVG